MQFQVFSAATRQSDRPSRAAARVLLLVFTCLGLAGCADSSGNGRDGSGVSAASLRAHPRDLMQQVIRCENNGGALANTPYCRKVLKINRDLF